MKATPVKLVYAQGYKPCTVDQATHVTLNIPGPTGSLTLPVIRSGTRDGTGCWTWNGSTDAPTLRPSVLTVGHDFRCHSWIADGNAVFLEDCSHDMRGQTIPLLDSAESARIDCGEAGHSEGCCGNAQCLPSAAPAQPVAEPTHAQISALPDIDVLAQEIRRVDGNHKMGAGALAEALMPFLSASHGQAPAGAAPNDQMIIEYGIKASRMMARDLTRFDAACEVDKYLREQGAPGYYRHRMSIILFGNDEGTEAARAPENAAPQPAPTPQADGQPSQAEPVPVANLHPKTADLVRRFATALAEKLAEAEKKYGYSDGWASPDWMDECRLTLREHLLKGDPRDVAAYCAFLWHHGESTALPIEEAEQLFRTPENAQPTHCAREVSHAE